MQKLHVVIVFALAFGCRGQLAVPPPRPSPVVAEILLAHVETLQVSIALSPFGAAAKDPGGGLRSVLLYSGDLRLEPPGVWPDGSSASAAVRLRPDEIAAVIKRLDEQAAWEGAEIFHSEAVGNPGSKPAWGRTYEPRETSGPTCEITAVFQDGEYHYYVVSTSPWGKKTAPALHALEGLLPPAVAEALSRTAGMNAET